MFRRTVLAFALLLPVVALAEDSATPAQDSATLFENYRNWALVEVRPMPAMPVDGTKLSVWVHNAAVRKVYVENPEDKYSLNVSEFEVFGKAVVRVFGSGWNSSEVYQMLVGNEWRNGKAGVMPKNYLAWKRSFPLFGKWNLVGLEFTLEAAEGKKLLKTTVMAEPKKEVSRD